MPKPALIYAWAILAAGAATAAGAAVVSTSYHVPATLVCLALAALAATFKWNLPGLTGTISPSFIFVLVAVGQLNSFETILVAAASAVAQALWRPKVWPTPLQVGFNMASLTLAAALAYGVMHQLPVKGVVAVAAAGVVLLVSNTMAVSLILCLLREVPLYTAWQAIQFWAVPYYLAGGILATVWAQAPLTAATVAAMAATSAYLLSLSYRAFAGRLQPAGF